MFRLITLFALIGYVSSFQRGFPGRLLMRHSFFSKASTSSSRLLANKVDGVEIEGDLSPLSDNVLVKINAADNKVGDIYIPDAAKERPTIGKVAAVGPGKIHPDTGAKLDMAAAVGDNVIYAKFEGVELKYNDESHQLVRDDDILLKYTGDAPTIASVECIKDNVLVRIEKPEDKTSTGIYLGPQSKKTDSGLVAKVGPGRQASNGEYMNIQVKPGDGVRFREYLASNVKIEGKDYVVVRATDILAKW
jgi:chaperonin GroES